MLVDLPEAALWDYRSSVKEPADLDTFWSTTLAEAAQHDIALTTTLVDTGLSTVDVYDVTFAGFGGHPIKGWLTVPRHLEGPLPAIVQYIGYGGGRGHAADALLWSASGYIHLRMDTRGQGSAWSEGATGDPVGSSGPALPGFMTRGLESPEDYYYRRLYTDAVRAVDAIKQFPGVDHSRIAVCGRSQGGGIAIAAAALRDDIAAAITHVPFLCDFRRGTEITDNDPYKEIARYLAVHRGKVDEVFETLSYFDCVNLASRATAPAFFSAALMDPVCPPSTVFGAYHRWAGPKEIEVWPYNAHEGGAMEDEMIGLRGLRRLFE